jgi:hypothetical protein
MVHPAADRAPCIELVKQLNDQRTLFKRFLGYSRPTLASKAVQLPSKFERRNWAGDVTFLGSMPSALHLFSCILLN